jgi:hypothetical protein
VCGRKPAPFHEKRLYTMTDKTNVQPIKAEKTKPNNIDQITCTRRKRSPAINESCRFHLFAFCDGQVE